MRPRITLLFTTLLLLCCLPALAQPTWRFHIAFEDGTGARDTLWLVYDTSVVQTQSHWPVDIGEYEQSRVNLDYGDGEFHVFTINDLIDSTNSMAFPYAWFPIFETGGTIDAINWEPPMTLRWDTSLFHAPYLPYAQGSFGIAIMGGDHFFFFNNHPELQAFDMLIDDSVFVPQDGGILFPFGVYFGPGFPLGVREEPASGGMYAWPNPAGDRLSLSGSEDHYVLVRIVDMTGNTVRSLSNHHPGQPIDLLGMAPGPYFVLAFTNLNQFHHAVFQKMD